jgi:putative sterol carrier protein
MVGGDAVNDQPQEPQAGGLPPDLDTDQVAQMVGTVPEEQLAEAMSGEGREMVLNEIFRRFPERVSDAGRQEDVAIEWRIGGGPGGEPESWFVVIKDGECTIGRELAAEPRVTFELDGVDFLKVVTGNANPVEMFMSGKLKIKGDLMYAARVQSMFVMPGRAGGPAAAQGGPATPPPAPPG